MASKISFEKAKEDIDRRIAADEMALHGISTIAPSTPFLRFRNFDSTPKTLDLLPGSGHCRVWSGPVGQRLGGNDPGPGVEAHHQPIQR
ncbi:hypothetical protein [Bradyrhizobium rifense]|uniref:hypothetical protein n=1 Tax=Bradyrhizobium rifense TaxID=515499 RepID=UPI001652E94F|nr:hypothetical protein [Bradyrhizobium rifense]